MLLEDWSYIFRFQIEENGILSSIRAKQFDTRITMSFLSTGVEIIREGSFVLSRSTNLSHFSIGLIRCCHGRAFEECASYSIESNPYVKEGKRRRRILVSMKISLPVSIPVVRSVKNVFRAFLRALK